MVIDADLLPPLINILQVAEFRTRKEAAWAITNATSGGSAEQIRWDCRLNLVLTCVWCDHLWSYHFISISIQDGFLFQFINLLLRHLVELGCIKPLCDLLTLMDSKIVQVALNGLENILRLGELEAKRGGGINPYCALIEEAYGMLSITLTMWFFHMYMDFHVFWPEKYDSLGLSNLLCALSIINSLYPCGFKG